MLPGQLASTAALKFHSNLKLSSQVPCSSFSAHRLPSQTLLYDKVILN
uniref:Uncharacterized protein n=1 Tax=Arundo donax TaxID=35708 RepID=A0A0A8Y5Z2_ARUDO